LKTQDSFHLRGFYPLESSPDPAPFHRGDVLVLFGELFNRGYANGLLEQAQKQGLTVVRCTVGRRDENNKLRFLSQEEKLIIPEPFINIPLEAGFDLEPDHEGLTMVDRLRNVKLSDWEEFPFPEESLSLWRQKGQARLRASIAQLMLELEKIVPEKSNVFFAHLMAGGVPRAKIVMPLMNRVVKGTGERFLNSKTFWDSSIGRLCAANFQEVTAESYRHLVELSESLRKKIEERGNRVSYMAYGYHGTQIMSGNQKIWQTYTPYLQGWAKLKLEEYSRDFFKSGIASCVYNCPEILTQSSHIFQGVEISLYPLIESLFAGQSSDVERQKIGTQCQQLLKSPGDMDRILKICENYFRSPLLKEYNQFDHWPRHSSQEQLEFMLNTSEELINLHTNPKQLMTFILSEVVFNSCGQLMMNDIWSPKLPVVWIGHSHIEV